MTIIFFDLETTDREFCGQILNYSFIRTNNNFQIEAELNGDISLSLLQIPSPEALLTNRVKILDHQARNFQSEPQAMLSILNFIQDSIFESKDQVYLAGYNSTRFDLPYLRTSFIRNGLNPYFSGKIKYCDILHLVRKAYLSNLDFPAVVNADDNSKLSLSLEVVSKSFGLLTGVQTHHSRDDVILTISLVETLNHKYSVHPASFNAYEARNGEKLILALSPNYELTNSERAIEKPLGLLSESYRASLWVDLLRYQAGESRAAISWFNKNGGQLIKQDRKESLNEYLQLLDKAKLEFKGITPDNFFAKSSCDIEQDIYRLDMQKISVLSQYIWNKDKSVLEAVKDKDLQDLISRYWLAYGLDPDKRGDRWQDKLKSYAQYRYGGLRFQLPKNLPNDLTAEAKEICYHTSLINIKSSIQKLLQIKTNNEDTEILNQLVIYIDNSQISSLLRDSLLEAA